MGIGVNWGMVELRPLHRNQGRVVGKPFPIFLAILFLVEGEGIEFAGQLISLSVLYSIPLDVWLIS